MNNGTLEIHVTANANGTLTASGFTGTFNCFGLTCKYESGNNNDIGTITGSSNTGGTATIDLNETLIGESNGPGCGTGNVTWEGTYKITSPDWLDVDSTPPPPTTLTCTEGSSKVQCPEGTELDASVEETLKLTTPGITVTCTEGTIKGSIENPNRVKTSEVTFNSPSCTNCSTITVTSGTLEIHTENNGIPANGNGTLTASGLTFHFVCFGVTCNYITGNNNDIGTITGSSNTGGTATIDINTTLTKEEGSSFVCGSGNATLEGSYKVTSPDWLDVD
jgi:hypothetical protein